MNKLLNESTTTQVPVKKLSSKELKELKNFQSALSILIEYFSKENKSLENYKTFKKKISSYLSLPYMYRIENMIEKTDKELTKIDKARTNKQKNKEQLYSKTKQLEKEFFNENLDKAFNLADDLKKINELVTKSDIKFKDVVPEKNPFIIEPEFIFPTYDLIKTGLGNKKIKELSELDLSKYKYSYLKWPESYKDDFQYIMYFLMKLQQNNDPVTISGKEVNTYSDFLYADIEGWDKLKKLVEKYLHNNDKKLVSKIIKMLKNFPALQKLNNKSKLTIKSVWRGIGRSEDLSINKVKEIDKKEKWVATSTSKRAALNFAYEIGHLESKKSRRSEIGYLINYKVDSQSIIMDFDIFGSAFFEDEVLIDATKAKIIDIEEV